MSRGSLSLSEAVKVSRPFWWVATAAPFVAGSLLAADKVTLLMLIGALYFTLPYNLLLYGVNDIFDYESDIRNQRKTGAVHGAVLSKIKHASLQRWILATNLPFGLYFFLAGNIESTVFLVMIIYLVLAYSVKGLRYKEIPFIDSLTSGFHYASPFLLGLLLFSSPTLWASVFAGFYFWAVGNHAFGAIQDITPDRRAKIKSVATYLGAGKTIIFCILMYALAITAPILEYGLNGLFAAAAIAPYLLVILGTWPYKDNDQSYKFRTAWQKFLVLNYVVGGIGSVILLYLYNK